MCKLMIMLKAKLKRPHMLHCIKLNFTFWLHINTACIYSVLGVCPSYYMYIRMYSVTATNQVQNIDVLCGPVDLENECTVIWDVSTFCFVCC